ncbi:MAG: hypothetical protein GY710_00630 [Desulfobacteraceae bacterium]|nr:hypothetical protein [Desulfobacteraceae bacterium]
MTKKRTQQQGMRSFTTEKPLIAAYNDTEPSETKSPPFIKDHSKSFD